MSDLSGRSASGAEPWPLFLKYVHILIPGTWEYVALHGDFAGVIKLRAGDEKSTLYYLGGPNIITKVLRRQRVREREEG